MPPPSRFAPPPPRMLSWGPWRRREMLTRCTADFSSVMCIPLDDHGFHRGHAVFDTAMLRDGHLYDLEGHIARFFRSAEAARIALPASFSRARVRDLCLATAAAGGVRERGSVRYWLSAGRGGFGLSPAECQPRHTSPSGPLTAQLYVAAIEDGPPTARPEVGWRLVTSGVEAKPPYFATLKSTNYLPNVLCVMDAQAVGCDQGVFLDPDGSVLEGPNMNLAIVAGGELVTPPFDSVLAGRTVQRAMELAEEAVEAGRLPGVSRVRFGKFDLEAAKTAAEVMVLGSGTIVMPVVEWDGEPVGGGAPGPAALALRSAVAADMRPRPGSPLHLPVPYAAYGT